jgi:hypothetical protein
LKLINEKVVIALVCLFVFAGSASGAESDSATEAWPEFNLYLNLNDKSRLFLLYSATRKENLGTYADGQSGIYFDYWALPPLRRDSHKHADASRSKLLLMRAGYLFSRPLNGSEAATEHMVTFEANARALLPASLLLSDRNRVDFRWVNGELKRRYRNRLKLEKTFRTGRFEFTPYGHGEVFYGVEQSKFTRLRYAAGMEWAITSRIVFEAYYLRQNDWTGAPKFVNAIGTALQFYLR